MRAYIKEDTKNSDKLWLFVERGYRPSNIDTVMGELRMEDSSDNVAYAILKDEVKLIKEACEEYLFNL